MYNYATVLDLLCRFAEGEVVTWEEFDKWINDILDGFNTHDHSGVSGSGPVLSIGDMNGYAALEARVAALESAGYATEAYADQAEADAKTYADGLVTDMATQTWVGANYYNKTAIDGKEATLAASIVDNLTMIGTNADDIDACEARLDAIELDYATEGWVLGRGYATTNWVTTNYVQEAECEMRQGIINANIASNESDINTNASDINACESDILSNASDIDDVVNDLSWNYWDRGATEQEIQATVSDSLSDHESTCINYET